jgi:hypothetical protein
METDEGMLSHLFKNKFDFNNGHICVSGVIYTPQISLFGKAEILSAIQRIDFREVVSSRK